MGSELELELESESELELELELELDSSSWSCLTLTADPPNCVGGVRRWRPRFPLSGSGCVCSSGVFERERWGFACTRSYNVECTRLHILTQSNTN